MGISINMNDEIFSERAPYLGNIDELMLEMHGEHSDMGLLNESPFYGITGLFGLASHFQEEDSTN